MLDREVREAPPKADAMIEALRGLGYTTATALADLIDNSISAGARRVDVDFHWAGSESWITLRDDGRGMSDDELFKAMRLGERNPLHERHSTDLGRFGLGLKTASFSQCRRLTVGTRHAGQIHCLCWDLDLLASRNDGRWVLLEGPHESSAGRLAPLDDLSHGTLILWEQLDRVVTRSFGEKDYLDLIDQVEMHLAMVFHRFLEDGRGGFELRVNGEKIQPWDPFLTRYTATLRMDPVQMGTEPEKIEVQGFVLPHKDFLSDKEFDAAGGPDGWAAQQGFYVYRNRRLLVAGSWLGLGRQRSWLRDESHRLARIRLDIPNHADADWKIDIRKSTACPPVVLRPSLIKFAEMVRDKARGVFVHRAQPTPGRVNGEEVAPVWQTVHRKDGASYRVDRDHPAVRVLADLSGEASAHVEALLRVLEETVPVQRIWLHAAESGEHPKGGFTGEVGTEVLDVLRALYRDLVIRQGMSPDAARRKLLRTEPFDLHPGAVNQLPDNPDDVRRKSTT